MRHDKIKLQVVLRICNFRCLNGCSWWVFVFWNRGRIVFEFEQIRCNVFQTVTLRPFQQHFLLVDFVIIISLRLGQPSLSAFTVFSN